MTEPQAETRTIVLVVDDDLRRSRLTVLFRFLLAIPQGLWLSIWSIAMVVVLAISWFAALFAGRVPDGLHEFNARFLRASTHLYAYVLLLANPWPPFLGEPGSYPVDLVIAPAAPQNRLTVFFRIVLAIPALLFAYVFRSVNGLVAVLGWFYSLATGRMHRGMRDMSAWMLGYELQTYGYLALLTGSYPSFSGGPRV